jgi:hypothetical protein
VNHLEVAGEYDVMSDDGWADSGRRLAGVTVEAFHLSSMYIAFGVTVQSRVHIKVNNLDSASMFWFSQLM